MKRTEARRMYASLRCVPKIHTARIVGAMQIRRSVSLEAERGVGEGPKGDVGRY